MMLSKLTSGLSLATVKAAAIDPAAAALLAGKVKGGAMGAAGIATPDKATVDALISALASEATGAKEWSVNPAQDPATKASILTASILRELASPGNKDQASSYRLVLACNISTHQGEMQLAWAPVPKTGILSVALDGKAPLSYKVEGTEKMGNGSQVMADRAAISLYDSAKTPKSPGMPLPAKTLRVSNLFSNESVEFPFADLPLTARRQLAACFE